MINVKRFEGNPIFTPNKVNPWESRAAFNGSVIKNGLDYFLLYRAMNESGTSIVGIARGKDKFSFADRKKIIVPDTDWDEYGCEDPRVTFMDGKYYIFYTALSTHPPTSAGIKVGLATSSDLKKINEKHLVTPFNAKAFALFPEKIDGKFAAILTANTDIPPAKIAIAFFDKESDIWSQKFWDNWYKNLDKHTIPLLWSYADQVEVGAVPVKTPYGWILIFSYFKNYFSDKRQVQVKIVLLDLKNPQKIAGILPDPILTPKEDYEKKGEVADTIFPTSATLENDNLFIYYSSADTSICLAQISLNELYKNVQTTNVKPVVFSKFEENPIIAPVPEHEWEKSATFNPTAIKLNGKIYIIYRAMGGDATSRLGLAVTTDGVYIDERLPDPIYSPREEFEIKKVPGNSGCEDPRITQIGDRLYVCYTAFTGEGNTRVAMTSISANDFIARKWNWEKPILITAPGIYDKDACIFPEKIKDKYLFLHRITPGISVDFSDTLSFGEQNWLKTQSYIVPRPHSWDDEKIGIGPTPVKTRLGWLLIYHGISKLDRFYRVGAMILDSRDPRIVAARTQYPILEPLEDWEKIDGRGIAFPCGMVEIGKYFYIYYGGGDKTVGVAKISSEELVGFLANEIKKKFLI